MHSDTTTKGAAEALKTKKMTSAELWGEKRIFQPKSLPGLRSMQSGLAYTVLEDKKRIVKYSYETGEKLDTLFDAESIKPKLKDDIESYDCSEDETLILIAVKAKKLYRHSFTAKYLVWDIKSKTLTPLSNRPKQRLATFSPDGTKVAFVSNNNLFIKDLKSGKETRVTNDGRWNCIINGAADWVYEEEFGLKKAFEWSPDGKYLAFQKFDESKVKQFIMLRYTGNYPERVSYKYPRAGEKNAVVTVHIYDMASRKTRQVDTGTETDQYIPRIKWTKSDGVLSVLRLNRLQNKMEYLLANAADGTSKVMHTEENERYLDADDSLTFLADRKHFIILSERSGWRHIHLFDMNGKHIRQITSGSWDVIDYYGYSDEAGRVYYSAARPTPLNRTIFSIKLDGTDEQVLSETNGCSSASFSKGFKYYINSHSTANTPPQFTLHNSSGKLVRVLEDNSVLKETLKQYYIPKKEFFSFKTSEGIELNGWMMKPEGFDPKKKYPVLMTVYGGPNSQTVTDSWNLGWEHYVMQHGYIIASVDGRGTGSRGEEFRKCTYQQLGKYEVIDQIEAAKYLGTLPYVDATRIGIFGWSYGGFMACGCILRGADVFKAAVAVASVTNFRYYDTIYTERYMGLPQDNLDGYDQNAPLSHADKLTGKLLLVHGVTDDNVHYQNSLELCEALVKAGKHFEVHFLPNRDHGISGGNTHLHLFGRMTDFLCDNL